MNKQEFLAALRAGLSGLSQEDLQRTLDFYAEIIDDCMEDGMTEAEAVVAVGPLDEILSHLRAESPTSPPNAPGPDSIPFPHESAVVSQPFSSLSVESSDYSVGLRKAPDGVCRVVYTRRIGTQCLVWAAQGVLTIQQQDRRSWLERLRGGWRGGEILVYLPDHVYQNLTIKSASGKVEVPDGFTLDTTSLHVVSSSVSCSAQVKKQLEVKTVSGSICLEGMGSPHLHLKVKSTSGRIQLQRMECDTLTAASTSGAISITASTAQTALCATNISGKVALTHCDAGSLELKTVSGQVSASLRSPKVFSAHTVSGRVSVPSDTSGGACKVTTVSGSITCTIQ